MDMLEALEKIIVAGKNITITNNGETLTFAADLPKKEIPVLGEDELFMSMLCFMLNEYPDHTRIEFIEAFKELLTVDRFEAAYEAFTKNS